MFQSIEFPKASPWPTALLLVAIMAVCVVAGMAWWVWAGSLPVSRAGWLDLLLKGVVCWALLSVVALLTWQVMHRGLGKRLVSPESLAPAPRPKKARHKDLVALLEHQREHYGRCWRRQFRVLLIVGEPAEIEAIAPGLVGKQWLIGPDTVLLWGGSVQADALFSQWEGLSGWRSLDGVVWALNTEQSTDHAALGVGVRRLRTLARALHWQLPLYLWQVCVSRWPQGTRETQPVGCALSSPVTLDELESHLTQLLDPLRQRGLAQVQRKRGDDFLLRLSQNLKDEGINRWRRALTPLLGTLARGVPLRGLWFSLALPKRTDDADQHWLMDPVWDGIRGDKSVHQRRLGWPAPRIAYATVMGLALLWGTGLLLSFASNRAHIVQVQDALAGLDQAGQGDEQLRALNELMRELGRLDYRASHGVPWYQRFGLSQNAPLLETLWPRYVEANHRLLRDPAAANLQRQL
ncbi:ImcF-related family protein, partial [Pseudomonas sp. ok272]